MAYLLPSTSISLDTCKSEILFVIISLASLPSVPPDLDDTIFDVNPILKGTIKVLYKTLLKSQMTTSDALRNTWSAELGEDIGPVAREHALRWVHSSSICARHAVLQCKVVHRVHWSKSKLARIYSDIDPNCDKCQQRPANLSHCLFVSTLFHRMFQFHLMYEVHCILLCSKSQKKIIDKKKRYILRVHRSTAKFADI